MAIDLALPFGWTGSPAHYAVFGSAISFLVRCESPSSLCPTDPDASPFFCFEWADDHMLIEEDVANRLELCECALRLAMLAVLGPRAVNEKKFTCWSTQSRALGLDWDTERRTVSIPEDKIDKSLRSVVTLRRKLLVTRTELPEVFGFLWHVCSCIRPAKPFFQRLAALHRKTPRLGKIRLSAAAILDLEWFDHILRHGRLRGMPLRYFSERT